VLLKKIKAQPKRALLRQLKHHQHPHQCPIRKLQVRSILVNILYLSEPEDLSIVVSPARSESIDDSIQLLSDSALLDTHEKFKCEGKVIAVVCLDIVCCCYPCSVTFWEELYNLCKGSIAAGSFGLCRQFTSRSRAETFRKPHLGNIPVGRYFV
jgi:hypothetical protein